MKAVKMKFFLLFFSFFAVSLHINAAVEVTTTLDTNDVLIGERIKADFILTADNPVSVTFPKIPDSLSFIEILEENISDSTVEESGHFVLKRSIILTSFEDGEFDLSPIILQVEKEGVGDIYPLQANLPPLKFRTVEIDSGATIKDIKAPIDEPLTFAEILPWIIGAVLIAAGVIIVLYLLKRFGKKKQHEILDFDPDIPPHILAFRQLKELDEEKLWQNNRHKEYYVRLTQIIRLYIQRKFDIPALEMTSGQLQEAVADITGKIGLFDDFREMTENADLVKFAKHMPLPDENSKAMSICLEFVEKTKPEEHTSEADS